MLIIFVGLVYAFTRSNPPTNNLVSPLSKIQVVQIENSLKDIVDDVLVGAKGTYGIAIKNLKTGEDYYLNGHLSFETGSLYKLWVMVTVFQQIQEGRLTEEEALSRDVTALNREFGIDPSDAELTDGTINFIVRDALNQMITISHNYAALILTEKVKLSSVATFLRTNGFKESTVGINGDAPKSTPSDIALFYEKLYRGKFADEQYTKRMVDLLKGQQLNDGLPKYLPAELQVAHKTGDIGWFKHDAGIVFTNQGDYIIVVMSESSSPPGAQERIALFSKAVYEYFTKK